MPSLNVNPALGRASTGFTMAGATVAANGAITVGTAKSYTGQLTSFQVTQTNETENISASTARSANEVITETMAVARVEGFLNANDVFTGSSTNPIWYITQNNDYVQMVGSWAGRNYSFIGVIKSYEENIAGKGKIAFTAEIGFPDIGSANPLWS